MQKVVLIICVALLISFQCSEEKSINLGFIGSLSGPLSDLGTDGRNGALIAIEEINGSGGINGRKITFTIRDDKHDQSVVVEEFHNLIKKNVDVIVGPVTSHMAKYLIPLANREKRLLVAPTVTANIYSGKDDYLIRTTPPNKYVAEHLARFGAEKIRIKKMAAIFSSFNKTYSKDWYEKFEERYIKSGGKIILRKTLPPSFNRTFLPVSKEIVEADPDGIVIIASAFETAMLCQQIRKLNAKPVILTSNWAKTTEFLRNGGKSVEGVFFSQTFDPNSRKPRYRNFYDRYSKRFNKEPYFGAFYGYEAIIVISEAYKIKRPDESLKDAIIRKEWFEGVQGPFRINRFGDSVKKSYLLQVRNGKYETVDENEI